MPLKTMQFRAGYVIQMLKPMHTATKDWREAGEERRRGGKEERRRGEEEERRRGGEEERRRGGEEESRRGEEEERRRRGGETCCYSHGF